MKKQMKKAMGKGHEMPEAMLSKKMPKMKGKGKKGC
jgi:hypothetical protein